MNDISEFRILFVGDNSHNSQKAENAIQEVFKAHPQSCPFSFRWVTGIPAAVVSLKENRFHLIIYDMESTDSVGLSNVEDLVAEAHYVPVVVMVDAMEKYLHMDLLDRGAQSYLERGDLSVERVYLTLRSVIAGLL